MAKIAPRPYEPDVAIPPGVTLREVLAAKGMTQSDLAHRMGRPANKVNEMVQGKRAITPETAGELELVLGWPASFWIQREAQYRAAKARLDAKSRLQEQVDKLRDFPLDAMAKLGWLKRHRNPVEQVRELLRFLHLASFEEMDQLSVFAPAWRKSPTKKASPYSLVAWLQRGALLAADMATEPFAPAKLRGCLSRLRALTLLPPDEFADKLVLTCAQCGVAVVFVPPLPRTYASGAAYWIGDKPVIQLSLRFRTNDHFWFSFFHEGGHLLLHGQRETFVDDFKGDGNRQECEANDFAARTLIPDREYRRLLTLHFRQESVVRKFAAEIGIAPGIVVGRLQHDGKIPYRMLNGLKATLAWSEEE
jgi:HTH-type transcriptional regulator/antitoxin HigA